MVSPKDPKKKSKEPHVVLPHILIPEQPEWHPDLDLGYDDLAVEESEFGHCDYCGTAYQSSNPLDHCAQEGMCWEHCEDAVGHAIEAAKSMGYAEGAAMPPDVSDMITKAAFAKVGTAANPLPVPDGEEPKPIQPPPGMTIGQYLQHVDKNEPKQLVDHVMRTMGAAEMNREATAPELVALYMTKLWIEAESQHAEVVAYSEGTTLKQHRQRNDDCPACGNLAYYDKAFDILRVAARQEIELSERRAQQAQFTAMGVCVECGKAPLDGRRYTLDEGQGFMCSDCCGPHLLMDDNQPGNPWKEG